MNQQNLNRPFKKDQRARGGIQFLGFICLFLLFLLDLEGFLPTERLYLQNIISIFVLVLLVGSFARTIPRCFIRDAFFHRPSKIPQRWFRLHATVIGVSIALLFLWLLRGLWEEGAERYHALLHAGMLMGMLSFAMGMRRVYFWWKVFDMTTGRMVFFLYGVIAVSGAILLILPWSVLSGQKVGVIDALFVSVSSIAVTGLSPINIATTFSVFGKLVILLLIQVGGLGIVLITVALVALTRSRVSLYYASMGKSELADIPNLGEIKQFVRNFLSIAGVIEASFAVFIYFSLPSDTNARLFQAVFHTVSSFCNAGFSTFEEGLEMPGLALFKGLCVTLIVLGGVGFHVLINLLNQIRPSKYRRKFSPDILMTLIITGVLFLGGATLIFFSETYSGKIELDFWSRVGHSLFFSATSRTAGFNSLPMDDLSNGSILIISILMIIGGGSLSTAGGIKVTTFGILLVATYSLFRGHKWIQFRKSEISYLVLQKAIAIVVLYFSALFISTLFLVALEDSDPLLLTFEVISALSTVGLSLGVTSELGSISKLIIICLMLIGRLGLVSIVYVGLGKISEQRFRYSKAEFFVG